MPSSNKVNLKAFNLSISSLELPIGLVLDEVEIRSTSASIGLDPARLSLDEDAQVTVRTSGASIAAYLEWLRPGGLSGFFVQGKDDKLLINARARVIVEIPMKATCRLVIVDAKQLLVELVDVDVLGVAAEKLVRAQLDRVNPILDAKDLPIPILLETVSISDDNIYISGVVAKGQTRFDKATP